MRDTSARQITAGLVQEISASDTRMTGKFMTLAALGETTLCLNIKAVEVELWLKHLERAAGTRCKIRNVMSVLFNHARRYDLYDRNPIQWVRQRAKTPPCSRSAHRQRG